MKHDAYLKESGAIVERRRAAFAHQVRQLVLGTLERKLDVELVGYDAAASDPYGAAALLLENFGIAGGAVRSHAASARTSVRATVKGLHHP